MLEKPDIGDDDISACLRDQFGLAVAELMFLPLGADRDTAVYRAVDDAGTPCFVKLRRGAFDEMTIRVPKLLHDQGIGQVIAPIAARSGQLWAALGGLHADRLAVRGRAGRLRGGTVGCELDRIRAGAQGDPLGGDLRRTGGSHPARVRHLRSVARSGQRASCGRSSGNGFSDPVSAVTKKFSAPEPRDGGRTGAAGRKRLPPALKTGAIRH